MNYIYSMNHVDAIIISIIVFLGIKGYINGFAVSVFNLLKYGVSIVLTGMYYKDVAGVLMSNEKIMKFFMAVSQSVFSATPNHEVVSYKAAGMFAHAGAVMLIFVVLNIAISLLVGVVDGFLRNTPLKAVNKLAGFIFGCLKGVVIVMLAFVVINPFASINPEGALAQSLNDSLLVKYFYMYNFMFKYFDGVIEIFNRNRLG